MSHRKLSQFEFVALMAMLSGTIAFSIDAMLPAMPRIAEDLRLDNPDHAQLVITSFVLGMGLGTLFTGTLSDTWGRRPIMLGGAVVYCLGALLAWRAPTLEVMLAARVLQGLGAAGPRVVAMAMTRDLYSGEQMARIMSFIMIVFTLVPAFAPSLGAGIIWAAGWRQIFLAFVVFSVISGLWLYFRQGETLTPQNTQPFSMKAIGAAMREMWNNPNVRIAIMSQMLIFGILMGMLSSSQQMIDTTYGHGAWFPVLFGAMALISSTSSMINAYFVVRVGMRKIVRLALSAQLVLSSAMIIAALMHLPNQVEFVVFLVWMTSLFYQAGLTMGNLNTLALEPLGHIAGKAASIGSAVATIGGAAIGATIGQAYDGTPLPMASAVLLLAGAAWWLTRLIKRPTEA